MKKFMLLMALTGALVFDAQAKPEKPTEKKPVEIQDIKLEFVDAPAISGGVSSLKSDLKTKWLKILVEYKTFKYDKKLRKKDIRARFKDNFSIKYSLLTNDGLDEKYKLLTGEVNYNFVSLDGKKHYAIALLPPQIYQKAILKDEYKYDSKELKKMELFVEIISNRGDRLSWGACTGAKSYKSYKDSGSLAKKISKAEPTLQGQYVHKNTILGRNKTPWAFVNYDDFEMIKEGR